MVRMENSSVRAAAVEDTRRRILDVALEVLGQNPDAGINDIAADAGVARRTVYGHFPARADLVRAIAQRAAGELLAVLGEVKAARQPADTTWVDFVARLWPVARRYRVLLALRRGAFGEEIHSLLRPVDSSLAELVQKGQRSGVFGRHLPAELLSQIALAAVFTIADSGRSARRPGARAAIMTSLLTLGVPEPRAAELAGAR